VALQLLGVFSALLGSRASAHDVTCAEPSRLLYLLLLLSLHKSREATVSETVKAEVSQLPV